MSGDQRSQDGYRSQGLPTYVVLDTSGSMTPHEQLLNDTLMHIYDTIDLTPQVSEFVHLSIVSFNNEPHLVTSMTDLDNVTTLPTVTCGGRTNFAPMFRMVRSLVESDVPQLASKGIRVLRPVIFVLTDACPTDPDPAQWRDALAELTDKGWKPHPYIITYGFGEASEAVLGSIANVAAFAAEKGTSNQGALAGALNSMLNSLVASAKAGELQIPEKVEGYRTIPREYVEM
jgi:uncharacterized protein YegL